MYLEPSWTSTLLSQKTSVADIRLGFQHASVQLIQKKTYCLKNLEHKCRVLVFSRSRMSSFAKEKKFAQEEQESLVQASIINLIWIYHRTTTICFLNQTCVKIKMKPVATFRD